MGCGGTRKRTGRGGGQIDTRMPAEAEEGCIGMCVCVCVTGAMGAGNAEAPLHGTTCLLFVPRPPRPPLHSYHSLMEQFWQREV